MIFAQHAYSTFSFLHFRFRWHPFYLETCQFGRENNALFKDLTRSMRNPNFFCPVVVFVYASDNNFKISEQEGTQPLFPGWIQSCILKYCVRRRSVYCANN